MTTQATCVDPPVVDHRFHPFRIRSPIPVGATISRLIAAFAATLLAGAACRAEHDSVPVVGVIVASSGRADFIGKPERAVLERLEQQYREAGSVTPGFTLRIKDSGGDLEQAVLLMRDFISDPNVVAVIGPSTSGEGIALADEAEAAQLPLLTLGASRKIVVDPQGRTRKWVFKFAQNDSLAAEALVAVMVQRRLRHIALLYSTDGFGKSGGDEFKTAAAKAGNVTICHEAGFSPSLSQPAPVVASIPRSCSAVVIWGTAPGPQLIVQAVRASRENLSIFLSHGNASHDFLAAVGSAAEGVVLVGSRVLLEERYLATASGEDQVIRAYRGFWHASFGGVPSHFGGHARDAYEVLAQILSGKGPHTRQSVRDAIERLSGFPGVTGTFSFSPTDHAGLTQEAFQVYEVKRQKFEPLQQ